MILIGSKAIKHWYADFSREGKDWDYIAKPGEKTKIQHTQRVECLVNTVFDDYQYDVMKPDDLLTLKMSHLFWDISWDKHMYDVQFLLKKGCRVDEEKFYRLYSYWNKVHIPNKRSALNMSKEDFFDNAINYDEHQHDELHKILNPVPIYTKILRGEVELDKDLWMQLSDDDKLDMVREEVMVMAYERYTNYHFQIAYHKMLKKFIITHAPIWSTIFTISNYVKLQKPNYDYFKKIRNADKAVCV